MNKPARKTSSFPQDPAALPPIPGHEELEDLSLGEWLFTMWSGRFLLLGTILAVLFAGIFYTWKATRIYRVNAMLQVEDSKKHANDKALAELSSLFAGGTQAQTEVEILRSGLVLGRAVEALNLEIQSGPVYMPIIGRAMARRNPVPPTLDIETFTIPESAKGRAFHVEALAGNSYELKGPDGEVLGTGMAGIPLEATLRQDPIRLKIREIVGKPGQRFVVIRQPLANTIEDLRNSLTVSEKGRQTGIVGLSFMGANPAKATRILDEILNQYIQQNIERRSEDVSKTLDFLREQMPLLRKQLEEAETRLNQFRMRSGSVDLTGEAESMLKQSVEFEAQMLVMKQKKDELLRTYNENHSVITTINEQYAKLSREAKRLEERVRTLPATQQEVLRLSRDVQVSTQLYTSLLNNIQQLQIAKAGQIGTARIVDKASAEVRPVAPNIPLVIAFSIIMGCLLGVALVHARKAIHRGVEDPRLIESKLGLPVYVTIPHSIAQENHYRLIRSHGEGTHLLATNNPEDLATESLKSLRTTIHFVMSEASNNAIMITGPSPSIGKSFVSSNFSAVLAQSGVRVLLIDADMRKGSLHNYFGGKARKNGLSEVLAGQMDWRQALNDVGIPGLDVIFTGVLPPNPSELLMNDRFAAMMLEVTEAYDYVIVDVPPVLAVTDANIIAAHVGTVVLLAKAGQHPLEEIRTCLKRFENSGIRVKGCIFNDVVSSGIGKYYRYAYHYGYKQ